jgi:H-NS histone family
VKQKVKKMASINVDKMSLKELVDLEAKVQKAIAAARDRERSLVKEKMAEMAKTHGFSVNELFGGVRARANRWASPNMPIRRINPILGQDGAASRIGWSSDSKRAPSSTISRFNVSAWILNRLQNGLAGFQS